MKVGSYAFKGSKGIDPALVGANSYGTAVRTQSWGWTLCVIAVQAAGTTLSMILEDSADNSTFAAVSGGTLSTFTASSVKLVLVKNSAVREYVRMHAQGSGNPVASVAMVQIDDASGALVGGCDLVIQ